MAARVLLSAAAPTLFHQDCCQWHGEDDPLPSSFVLLARWHRLAPAVYDLLKEDQKVDPALLESLRRDVVRQGLVRLSMAADLRWLCERFSEVTDRWVVVKGPVVAERLWPNPAHRQYHDLDVLVLRRDFAAVVELLEHEGTLLDRNWPLTFAQSRSQLSFRLPHGTLLDLHWDLVHEPAARASLRLDTEDLLENASSATVLGVDVWTLDPVDTLLHLAYHAASSGAHRLVWLRDLHLAASALPDPQALAVRSRATKTHLLLAAVLGRVVRTFGLPWPLPRMLDTTEAWWASLGTVVDRRCPVPYLGIGRTGQTYYRCLRGGVVESALLAGRSLGRHARRRPTGAKADPTNPLHEDVPDRWARRRYLSTVGSLGP